MLRVNQDIVGDDERGKLFVGGLSWETSQDNLQNYFSRYGDVIDCVVMKNVESGRSRGFGFVTFADPSKVNVVLQNGPHLLDGRTIDPKPCSARTLQKPKKGSGYPKVFLGGLPSNVTETDLRNVFSSFGKVMESVIMFDQEKKKSRGFGFLSFEDDDAVERCVSQHFVNMNGKMVEVKRAEPRNGNGGGKMGGMMLDPSGWRGGDPMNCPPMNHQNAAGYGAPGSGPPTGYQGWGAPPVPQGPPHQWGGQAGYGGPPPPTQQGYGQYGYVSTSDMYSHGGAGSSAAPGAALGSKSGNGGCDYGYSGYGGSGSGDMGSQVSGYTSGGAVMPGYQNSSGNDYVNGPLRGVGGSYNNNNHQYHPYTRY